jgi:hypothetical protein
MMQFPAFITKIKTLRGKNPKEVHNALRDICRDSAEDCGSITLDMSLP